MATTHPTASSAAIAAAAHAQHADHHDNSPDGVAVVAPAAALSIASAHRGKLRGGRCRCAGRVSAPETGAPSVAGRLFRPSTTGSCQRCDTRRRDACRLGTPIHGTHRDPARRARHARGARAARAAAARTSSRAGSVSRSQSARPSTRSRPRSPTTAPISTRAATGQASQALRRRCAGVLRAALPPAGLELELEPLLDALLASLRFTRVRGRRGPRSGGPARGASGWWWSATGTCRCTGCLRALELEPLLDGIITSAEVGARKPAPAIFERALALAGVASRRGDPRRRQPRRGRRRRSRRRNRAGAHPPATRRRRCPACGRSRVWPSWPGSTSRGP